MYRHDRGFTLVELMLSMAIISVLLVTIATFTSQLSKIYTKGITLREINQVSRTVVRDIRQTIASSEPFILNGNDASYLASTSGGRLCLGEYSYVWNYADVLQPGATIESGVNKYEDSSLVRFAKVSDSGRSLCASPEALINKTNATELLAVNGERELLLYKLSIQSDAYDSASGQQLYRVALQLGTNDTRAIDTVNGRCLPPSSADADELYCAMNVLTIIARAGNRGAS